MVVYHYLRSKLVNTSFNNSCFNDYNQYPVQACLNAHEQQGFPHTVSLPGEHIFLIPQAGASTVICGIHYNHFQIVTTQQ